jgi:hypothetical protein
MSQNALIVNQINQKSDIKKVTIKHIDTSL